MTRASSSGMCAQDSAARRYRATVDMSGVSPLVLKGRGWPVAVMTSGSQDETIKLWETRTGKCLNTLRGERPYERLNISGVTGLTEAEKASLRALGAREHVALPLQERRQDRDQLPHEPLSERER